MMQGLPQYASNDFDHMWDGWGMGWGMGWAALWMLLIWIAVVGLVTWGVVALVRSSRGGRQDDLSARELLDRRFVAGELDEAEYQRARQLIEHGRSTPR